MFLISVAIGGDGAVGKSAIRDRYISGNFTTQYKPTVGVDIASKEEQIEGEAILFQFWDLAGTMPELRSRDHLLGVMCGIVVYSVIKPDSFDNVKNWIEDFLQHSGNQNISLVLVGNKIDLRDRFLDHVTREQGQTLARKLGYPFLETSAKTGENISEIFKLIEHNVIKQVESNSREKQ